jgi:UDP-GlcNAc:undecaprenyl-phosphate GlcNAc-1-phosphate transferase
MEPSASSQFFGAGGQLLLKYSPVFFIALVVSLVATPLFGRLAARLGVVDRPSGRKLHARQVPYLGGGAMLLGWLTAVGVGAVLFLSEIPGMYAPLMGIMVGTVIVTVIGLLDDVVDLPPLAKLVGQVVAALVLLAAGVGAGLVRTSVPLHALGLDLEPGTIRVVSLSASLLLVIAVCNSANLLDGLDGLCSGVIGIMVAALLAVSLFLSLRGADLVYDPTRMIMSLALMGVVLGFIPYNFNPASIFMGDAGSMLLGFNVAALLLLMGDRVPTSRFFWSALVVFGLPAFDTVLAIIRRVSAGRSPFAPDANHLHHQLIRQGLTVRQAVSLLYLTATLFAIVGLLMVHIRLRYGFLLLLGIGLGLGQLTVSFRLHRYESRAGVDRSALAELSRDDGDGERRPSGDGGSAASADDRGGPPLA